mmetsp:Transcript_20492/g.81962  ORF Transcript_20492/g.81962 Transcript_20492/m.81962 type:complete len:773 (-) Transcript_20492:129-2447(-)
MRVSHSVLRPAPNSPRLLCRRISSWMSSPVAPSPTSKQPMIMGPVLVAVDLAVDDVERVAIARAVPGIKVKHVARGHAQTRDARECQRRPRFAAHRRRRRIDLAGVRRRLADDRRDARVAVEQERRLLVDADTADTLVVLVGAAHVVGDEAREERHEAAHAVARDEVVVHEDARGVERGRPQERVDQVDVARIGVGERLGRGRRPRRAGVHKLAEDGVARRGAADRHVARQVEEERLQRRVADPRHVLGLVAASEEDGVGLSNFGEHKRIFGGGAGIEDERADRGGAQVEDKRVVRVGPRLAQNEEATLGTAARDVPPESGLDVRAAAHHDVPRERSLHLRFLLRTRRGTRDGRRRFCCLRRRDTPGRVVAAEGRVGRIAPPRVRCHVRLGVVAFFFEWVLLRGVEGGGLEGVALEDGAAVVADARDRDERVGGAQVGRDVLRKGVDALHAAVALEHRLARRVEAVVVGEAVEAVARVHVRRVAHVRLARDVRDAPLHVARREVGLSNALRGDDVRRRGPLESVAVEVVRAAAVLARRVKRKRLLLDRLVDAERAVGHGLQDGSQRRQIRHGRRVRRVEPSLGVRERRKQRVPLHDLATRRVARDDELLEARRRLLDREDHLVDDLERRDRRILTDTGCALAAPLPVVVAAFRARVGRPIELGLSIEARIAPLEDLAPKHERRRRLVRREVLRVLVAVPARPVVHDDDRRRVRGIAEALRLQRGLPVRVRAVGLRCDRRREVLFRHPERHVARSGTAPRAIRRGVHLKRRSP